MTALLDRTFGDSAPADPCKEYSKFISLHVSRFSNSQDRRSRNGAAVPSKGGI